MTLEKSAGFTTYSWEYGGDLQAALEIKRFPQFVRYLNTNIKMGPDTGQAKRFDPVMRRVNNSIRQRCHLNVPDHNDAQ